MVFEGGLIAREITAGIRASLVGDAPIVRAIVMAPSAATESYLRIKEARAREAGMYLELIRMENDATTEDLLEKIALPGADSIIVQLPLPEQVDTKTVLDAIPLSLDADVLSTAAHDAFEKGDSDALLPPVVAAMKEILERSGVEVQGKRAVVIGQGWLVGEPCAAWLAQAGVSVETLTRDSGDLSILKNADIVVSGAGSPGLIRPEHLMNGVVLIDAGTSESGGAIVGDADPACAELASVFTPVPGGVGPIAVACLFANAALLTKRHGLQSR
ncbi:MAG: 5,10-methylenetetrahydrofolate dehydrogenase [Parcubacteria group bacterium]|nr:5,10-methylenetetrahydrofolate dehydrogenase [Parcubacteria group bacterium]